MGDWHSHLAIGTAALARGLITLREFGEAMVTAAEQQNGTADDVWVREGRLSSEQIAELSYASIALVGGTRAEMVRSGSAPRSGAQVAQSVPSFNLDRSSSSVLNSSSARAGGTGTLMTNADPVASLRAKGATEALGPMDRYTTVGTLGSGGMGDVVECIDTTLARRVALKSVRLKFERDSEHTRLLEKEARLTGSLEHPNIVPIYDMGYSHELGPFYVMRRVEQSTLADALQRLATGEPEALATYTLGRMLRWFIQVCEAVEYAHNRGVIHRDLKPANILLGSFGEVLVADWGFAHRLEERTSYRGGTIGYSAPEQFELVPNGLDARADVFALGAILYEIVTLQCPFGASHEGATRPAVLFGWQGYRPAQPPQEVAGDRVVPEEIAEVCLKALSLDRNERFGSAREMARAIESFLEGTKEKERRRKRAEELVEEAAVFAEHFHDYVETRPTQLADLVELRNSSTAWDPSERRKTLWNAEDRLSVTDALAIRTLHAAVSSYAQALDEVPGHKEARRGLARLYWAEMQRAEERRDEFDRIYAEELVRQYDDGLIAEELSKGGYVSVSCTHGNAEVFLETLGRQERRLVPTKIESLGKTPIAQLSVPRGSHVVILRRDGAADIRCPILVRGGQELVVTVDLDHTAGLAPGETFIPGGPALFADEEAFSSWGTLRTVEIDPFVILEKPVSFAEYLAFLEHVKRTRGDEADQHCPRTGDGTPYFKWTGERYEPVRVAELGEDIGLVRYLPAFGVSALDAEAFAAWKSKETGRNYRLPTEDEWEKTARGVDGRRYPWGDHFDPSFCHMRDSRRGLARPEPSGSFQFDVSVYEVCDLAGSIAEWVVPAHGTDERDPNTRRVVSRGGAWCDWAADCALSARRRYLAVERSPRVGFRLARSVR
jgi:serine/threonine protein kinase/formylglycine-generating enzyme required for sulfatase activity